MGKELFCENWRFGRAGEAKRTVLLPHDAMQEQERRPDAPSGRSEAFYLGGSYEYEKTIFAPAEWETQRVYLEFEGVYPTARVLLNGVEIGICQYGYSRFRVELAGLKAGQENTVTVLVDDESHPNSRWYAGAGIYRPVWLLVLPETHILPDGVKVTTLSHDPAVVRVETACSARAGSIAVELLEGDTVVARGQGADCTLTVPGAKLWDAEHPNLYTCRAILTVDGEEADRAETPFGIRTVSWSSQGFFVNGNSVLLKGGCIHHDQGILGARTFDISEYRRVRILKEFGFNAIRSAHNPLSRAALEACDRLGMYVMDEAWDGWYKPKNPYDHGKVFMDTFRRDLEEMIAKDYNHPSVVMYSIGNEVTEPGKPQGVEVGQAIIDTVKALDATRPVTAGINLTLLFLDTLENNPLAGGGGSMPGPGNMSSTDFNNMVMEMGKRMTMAAAMPAVAALADPILDRLDIAGYNYATSRYENEGTQRPGRIVVGSETYPYDLGEVWPMVEEKPYLIGDFMWTAWDYLGEVGIGAWSYGEKNLAASASNKDYPWLLADTGALDILGHDNAEAGLAAVVWEARKAPYIGVMPVNHPGMAPLKAMWRGSNAIPHWGWAGCDGNEATVEVYAKAPRVELLVNGVSQGMQSTEHCKAVFETVYRPGQVKAVAYFADGAREETVLHSAQGKTRIRITPEERGEVHYLAIDLVGENGAVECNADCQLTVTVEGGELLAFGSANPRTEERYLSGSYTTYYGRALAVVKPRGSYTVTVRGGGMEASYTGE